MRSEGATLIQFHLPYRRYMALNTGIAKVGDVTVSPAVPQVHGPEQPYISQFWSAEFHLPYRRYMALNETFLVLVVKLGFHLPYRRYMALNIVRLLGLSIWATILCFTCRTAGTWP